MGGETAENFVPANVLGPVMAFQVASAIIIHKQVEKRGWFVHFLAERAFFGGVGMAGSGQRGREFLAV